MYLLYWCCIRRVAVVKKKNWSFQGFCGNSSFFALMAKVWEVGALIPLMFLLF